jgi:predicted nucleotidyltransferase
MGISEEIIDEIIRRVTSVVPAERIILFGSAASGDMTRDSDIDLLIVEPTVDGERDEWVRVRESLRGLGYPFDIILMSRERYDETKDIIGGMAYPATKQGRVIYEAA